MVSDKTDHHPMGEQPELINILPHKLTTTNDQLTLTCWITGNRAGDGVNQPVGTYR